MSRTELHIGTIRKVDTQGKSNINFAKDILKNSGEKMPYYYESELDWLIHDFEITYFLVNGELYEIIENSEFEDSDIAEGRVNADGSISYVASFYNGGTCLSEVLEEIVEKIKN